MEKDTRPFRSNAAQSESLKVFLSPQTLKYIKVALSRPRLCFSPRNHERVRLIPLDLLEAQLQVEMTNSPTRQHELESGRRRRSTPLHSSRHTDPVRSTSARWGVQQHPVLLFFSLAVRFLFSLEVLFSLERSMYQQIFFPGRCGVLVIRLPISVRVDNRCHLIDELEASTSGTVGSIDWRWASEPAHKRSCKARRFVGREGSFVVFPTETGEDGGVTEGGGLPNSTMHGISMEIDRPASANRGPVVKQPLVELCAPCKCASRILHIPHCHQEGSECGSATLHMCQE